MPDAPEPTYVTFTSPKMLRGRKPCDCGCGGQRHRVKCVMEEWAEPGAGGKIEIPVLWPTKLSAGERDRHRASLEAFDEEVGQFRRYPEWSRYHWIAACVQDHQNHRVWTDLKEAREQLGDCDDDEIEKLVKACDEAQKAPGRAEGNDADSTSSEKPSGTSPSKPDTEAPTPT